MVGVEHGRRGEYNDRYVERVKRLIDKYGGKGKVLALETHLSESQATQFRKWYEEYDREHPNVGDAESRQEAKEFAEMHVRHLANIDFFKAVMYYAEQKGMKIVPLEHPLLVKYVTEVMVRRKEELKEGVLNEATRNFCDYATLVARENYWMPKILSKETPVDLVVVGGAHAVELRKKIPHKKYFYVGSRMERRESEKYRDEWNPKLEEFEKSRALLREEKRQIAKRKKQGEGFKQ